MTPQFASRWLYWTGWLFFSFGLIFVSSAFAGFDTFGRIFVDGLHWPPFDGVPGAPSQEARWMNGIGGGLTCGFGLFFVFGIAPLIKLENEIIRRATIIAMTTWFIIDSSGSIAAGVTSNAVFNFMFYVIAMFALMRVKFRS